MKIFALIRKIIGIAILVGCLIALASLKNNPVIAETFTVNVTSKVVGAMGNVTRPVKISITEILFIIVAFLVIFNFVRFIICMVRIKIIKGFCRLLSAASTVLFIVLLYSFSCELAYNRDEMPLPFYEEEVERSEFVNIYNYFVDDINYCADSLFFKEDGEVDNGYKLDNITDAVNKAYQIISDPYFYPTNGSVKPMMSSFIYRELQITGVTFSPLGEANINIYTPMAQMPLVVAHEIAHTKGVMRENDANQLAFYVCLNSSDPYLRYAAYVGYFDQLESMTSSSYLTAAQRENLKTDDINPVFFKSRNYVNKYWEDHDSLAHMGDFFNDLYLKNSGVKDGTSSYSGGTASEFDPSTNKFTPSQYQKLFFRRYYF